MLTSEAIQQLREALEKAFPHMTEEERNEMLRELEQTASNKGSAKAFIEYHGDSIAKVGVKSDRSDDGRRWRYYFVTEDNKEYFDL